jgi:hypothetical protein
MDEQRDALVCQQGLPFTWAHDAGVGEQQHHGLHGGSACASHGVLAWQQPW